MKKKASFDVSRYARVDLHLHLDGSLSPEDLVNMAQMEGETLPADRDELLEHLICPETCNSLNIYLQCFRLPNLVMQTRQTISYATEQLVKRLDQQGLVYAEIRFAPQKHMRKGLTQDEVVQASIQGLEKGLAESSNGIKANIILSCMRGDNNEQLNMETVSIAPKYLGHGVCAVDLAGAEALYPTSDYEELFAKAREYKLPFTIHAGEADGVESMHDAIRYGARRLGHGIRAYNDLETKELLKERDICLECCPTSNLQTKAVYGLTMLSLYPLHQFLSDGVAISINTDNMTVSDTTIHREFSKLQEAGILNEAQASLMLRNAIDHAFITDAEKAALKARVGL